MYMTEFIEKFVEAVEIESVDLAPEMEFRNIEEWSSLSTLSLIAMVDEEYGKTLTGEHIRQSKTIEDLYNIVESLDA